MQCLPSHLRLPHCYKRLSIEEMLATDKKQRTEVGSAFESFLIGSQQISSPCACSHTQSFDGAKADSEAEEHIANSGIGMFPFTFPFVSCPICSCIYF